MVNKNVNVTCHTSDFMAICHSKPEKFHARALALTRKRILPLWMQLFPLETEGAQMKISARCSAGDDQSLCFASDRGIIVCVTNCVVFGSV